MQRLRSAGARCSTVPSSRVQPWPVEERAAELAARVERGGEHARGVGEACEVDGADGLDGAP